MRTTKATVKSLIVYFSMKFVFKCKIRIFNDPKKISKWVNNRSGANSSTYILYITLFGCPKLQ